MNPSLARQGGGILIGLILTMVAMSVLGAAMVPLFSASAMTEVEANRGRQAYFLAESGFRYAAAEYYNAADSDKNDLLAHLDGRTFNLPGNRGSFTLHVHPRWLEVSSRTGNSVTATIPGTMDGDMLSALTSGSGRIVIDRRLYMFDSAAVSGSTVTFSGVDPSPTPAVGVVAGVDVLLAAPVPSGNQNVGSGGSPRNLTLDPAHAGLFPLKNGLFSLHFAPGQRPDELSGGERFSYERRVGNTLRNIALVGEGWTGFTVPDTTTVILDKFVRLVSVGNYGGATRHVHYNIPVGWLDRFARGGDEDEWEKIQHRGFESAGEMGSHSIDNGRVTVTGVINPTTSGITFIDRLRGLFGWGGDGLWAVNVWDHSPVRLDRAWEDSRGTLSYDLQVKVNTDKPYFFAGLGFRMRNVTWGTGTNQSDLHTYGVSFVRQRETRERTRIFGVYSPWSSWGFNDGIHPALRPYVLADTVTTAHTIQTAGWFFGTEIEARYSQPAIVFWQRTGASNAIGSFKILGYRTILPADGITTGSGTGLRLKPWTSLMVRLVEGYQIGFASGRVDGDGRHLKYGDTIKNYDGDVTARVIGTPVITGTNWGAPTTEVAGGRLILSSTDGSFGNAANLYLKDGGENRYAVTTEAIHSQKRNYIMVYFGDTASGSGNLIQADRSRLGNALGHANWPPDDWTDRTAGNDFLSLIGANTASATPLPWTVLDTTAANFFGSRNDTDFHQSVIRTWALESPEWIDEDSPFEPFEGISLITSSSAGPETQYDDFAIQLDMRRRGGTGFLPPIQE